MSLLERVFPADRSCRLTLSDGHQLRGAIIEADVDWLLLEREGGDRLLINRTRVLAISEPDQQPLGATPTAGRPPRDRGSRAKSATGGAGMSDDQLRELADAFLENAGVKELAERFGKTRSLIKELRMAFEAARGNCNEDDLGPVAVTWVGRWQAVLSR